MSKITKKEIEKVIELKGSFEVIFSKPMRNTSEFPSLLAYSEIRICKDKYGFIIYLTITDDFNEAKIAEHMFRINDFKEKEHIMFPRDFSPDARRYVNNVVDILA